MTNKLAEYERQKKIIAATARSAEEYERRVKELAERVKF